MSTENSKSIASEQRGGVGAGNRCLVNFARLLLLPLPGMPSSVSCNTPHPILWPIIHNLFQKSFALSSEPASQALL